MLLPFLLLSPNVPSSYKYGNLVIICRTTLFPEYTMELDGFFFFFFLCYLDFSKCFLGSGLLYWKVNSLAMFAGVSKSSCLLTSPFSFNQKHGAEPYLDEMLLICYLLCLMALRTMCGIGTCKKYIVHWNIHVNRIGCDWNYTSALRWGDDGVRINLHEWVLHTSHLWPLRM